MDPSRMWLCWIASGVNAWFWSPIESCWLYFRVEHTLYPCVVYRACCGYWSVQKRVCVCVCACVCVCVCVCMCVCVCVCVWTREPLSALCANKTAALWDTGHPGSNSITLLKYYTSSSQGPGPSWCVCMSEVCVSGYICVCVFICTCKCVTVQLWIVLCVFTHGVVSGLTDPSQYTVCVCSLSAGVLIDLCPVGRILEYVKAWCLSVRPP